MILPGDFLPEGKRAKAITPRPAVGCLLDGFANTYVEGVEHGEEGHMIQNGACSHTTGVLGAPNQFKSTFGDWLTYSPLNNMYEVSTSLTMDSEDSKEYKQQELRIPYFDRIRKDGVFGNPRIWMTRQSIMKGSEYWDTIRKPFGEKKRAEGNKGMITTCFLNGKDLIKIPAPTFEMQDSFSRMNFDDVEAKYHDIKIDSKDRNMEFMRPGIIKTRILSEMPNLNPRDGFYTVMCAHLGKDIPIDAGYGATPKKVLANLEAGTKIKGCPEQFLYMPNNMWFCANQKPHWDKDMVPIYGRGGEAGTKGSKDVVEITVMNLRGKSGSSGSPFRIIASQTLGLMPYLTMFHYLRETNKYYGMEAGNSTTMALDLCPDVKMTRNKVWEKTDEDVRLQRAIELTSGLCQLKNIHWVLGNIVHTPPAEIFKGLKEKGYDWDVILGETRGLWLPDEVKSDKHYLSAYDLLRMYTGVWMPSWLGKPRNVGKK